MPVDASNNANTSARRLSRKLTTDEEVDVRRARGELSCAECRRLKLKCDKKLPCSSCIRRGCPSICPNGSLATGQGTRFVLADTAHLHSKIAEMGQRIRLLEDALAIFQSSVSNECHPLLRQELLAIKFGPEKGYNPVKESPKLETSIESIDALGTLTIGDHGEGPYFGRSAGSETLFLAGADMETSSAEEDEVTPLSWEISRLSNSFPFGPEGPWDTEPSLDILYTFLPPQPRAWTLCETYLEHSSWAFRPIKREEIIEELLTPIYKSLKERQDSGFTAPHSVSSHKLAALMLIFALGALLDLTLTPYNIESENYYHLSRAALSLHSIFDCPEIATVQAVVLMAAYHSLGGRRYTMDSSWSLMSLGSKLAQSIGLHRDSARWNMDAKTVERRRSLFWEIFSTELFYSLALGRPPAIRMSYIDCEFPADDEAILDQSGQPLQGYYRWKYEFTKDLFSTVTELTLTAEAPNYQTVLELDRKVREKSLPPHLNVFVSANDDYCTPSAYMRGTLLNHYRSVTLLYIHRSFFAQAMLDHPVNPLRSPYAPSFLAAYRCASWFIKNNLKHFDRFPDLSVRWWTIWTHLFSAAIIVASIVTRAPSSSMASTAFVELDLACGLFEKGAQYSRRARSGLAVLCKLRDKAHQAYSRFNSGNPSPNADLLSSRPDYGEDELAIFGGQTRVLVSKLLSKRGHRKQPSSSAASPLSTPLTLSTASGESESKGAQSPGETIPDVHPSLVEYLSQFPQSQHTFGSQSEQGISLPSSIFSEQYLQSHTAESSYQPSARLVAQQQSPALPSWQQRPSNFTTSNAPIQSFKDEPPAFFDGLQGPSSFAPSGFPSIPPDDSLVDFRMMMSGESGIDEQWVSFMRDSGFLDGNLKQSPGPSGAI